MTQPISLLICALGGEGGGLLSEWLMNTARLAGYPAQSTSIPGVAQRTGATTYYIEVLPTPLSALHAQPVFSLNPVPGALDTLLSSELLETARQISLGLVSTERTRVFSSTARSLTTLERMPLGDGRLDNEALVQLVHQFAQQAQLWDFGEMARANGTLVSAVMLGVVAGSGLLPFARAHFEATLQTSGAHSAASLRGFAHAFERVQTGAALQAMLQDEDTPTPAAPMPEAVKALPEAVRDMAALGHARLLDYQGQAYADLYLKRLQSVVNADRQYENVSAKNDTAFGTSREVARWLALWMAFDDIVRVADLKSRASRMQRVAREVKAQPHELLKVYDHFKPGVPELAALLPQTLAAPLLRWQQRRLLKGQEPWAWPLKVGSHTVLGLLALRLLASVRWLRPHSSRFQQEQADIEQWLQAVTQGLREDAALGLALAECGRLIKGYGSTNERAKRHLQHILQTLSAAAINPSASWRSQAITQARQAALQDEAGGALNRHLQTLGVNTLPAHTHPLRFVRNATRVRQP